MPDVNGCYLKDIARRWEKVLREGKDRKQYWADYYLRKVKSNRVKMNSRAVRAQMHKLDRKRCTAINAAPARVPATAEELF